jgi:Cu2+-exporting ATPase
MSCALCDLPTPNPPVTDPEVAGEYCCQGCLAVARTVEDLTADGCDSGESAGHCPDDAGG